MLQVTIYNTSSNMLVEQNNITYNVGFSFSLLSLLIQLIGFI